MKKRKLQKTFLCATTALSLSILSIGDLSAETVPDPGVTLDKLINAMGGHEVWASGHGVYILAAIYNEKSPLPFSIEFCWSWNAAQTLMRQKSQKVTRLSGYSGGYGWTVTARPGNELEFTEWDQDRIDYEKSDWHANFSRTIHRIAKGDKSLSFATGLGEWDGWLEIRENGTPLSYIKTDVDGNPVSFRSLAEPIAVNFKPNVERGGYSFPRGGLNEGGANFDIIAFQILQSPLRATFTPKKDFANLTLDCR